MIKLNNLTDFLDKNALKALFIDIYGEKRIESQKKRYMELGKTYKQKFNNSNEVSVFSTPGRTEVGGNHTDHNAGRVLAAAVTLDDIAIATPTDDNVITLYSEGYSSAFIVDLSIIDVVENEKETTQALLRGCAAGLQNRGYKIGGFNACLHGEVLKGSGLSSSACIEVLCATILNEFYNDGKVSNEELAIICKFAENNYYGKPSGLMDQMTCSVGGFVTIDFKDADNAVVECIDFDFAHSGYSLLVVDTGGSHSDLTDDYADIPYEMKDVASKFDKEVLRGITIDDVIDNMFMLKDNVNDRAILRAIHFILENDRVVDEVNALKDNDFDEFLKLVNASGDSSWRLLQNCFSCKDAKNQGITLALTLTQLFLRDKKGACRVHGGGFEGTIQVFMPTDFTENYIKYMENVLGSGCVSMLGIRPQGTICIDSLV